MQPLIRSCVLALIFAFVSASPAQAQLLEYFGGGGMVGNVGPVPDFLSPIDEFEMPIDAFVEYSFVFNPAAPPIDETPTSTMYAGVYGFVKFAPNDTRLLFDVTVTIVNDSTNGLFSYFFRGVTVEGWQVLHSAYSTHSSFVPSLSLPTESPSWPPEPDSFAAGYVDVIGPDYEWQAYSDSELWFDVAVVSPVTGWPVITEQPVSDTVRKGKMAKFEIKVSGAAPLAYQWLKNGLPLAGETSRSLKLKKTTAADAGAYCVVVSNDAGVVVSDVAILTFD